MFLRDLARRASMGRREGAATAAAAAERGVDASGAAHAGSPPRSPLFSSRGVGSAPSSPGASPPAASPSSPRPGSAPGAVPPFALDGGPPEAGPLIRGVGACEEANLRYRPTHEDAHSVDFGVPACDAPAVGGSATPEPHHGVLFGVYDGHGGVEVARCVAPRRCGRGAPTRGADSRRFPTCANLHCARRFAADGLHLHCRRALAAGAAPAAALVAAYLATDAEARVLPSARRLPLWGKRLRWHPPDSRTDAHRPRRWPPPASPSAAAAPQ